MTTTRCRRPTWPRTRPRSASSAAPTPRVTEGYKKEEQGIYEIDDAKCKMGTMDIKLDKDFSVILISSY